MLFKKNTKNKGSSCQISFQGLFAVLPLCSGYLAPSTVGPALVLRCCTGAHGGPWDTVRGQVCSP